MNTAWNSSPLAACTVMSCKRLRAGARLVLAGFQRGMGEEVVERAQPRIAGLVG